MFGPFTTANMAPEITLYDPDNLGGGVIEFSGRKFSWRMNPFGGTVIELGSDWIHMSGEVSDVKIVAAILAYEQGIATGIVRGKSILQNDIHNLLGIGR